MTLNIGDTIIRSDVTEHVAWRLKSGDWRVSWIPERGELDRNHAVTAMNLAETARREELHADNPYWPAVESWARELGVSGPDAVARVTEDIDPEELVGQGGDMLPMRDADYDGCE